MKAKYDVIYNEVFSEYFIYQRKKNNYTIDEVGNAIGTIPQTYYYYERGKRDCPLSVFKALCEFYHIDLYDTFHHLVETTNQKYEQY